MMVIFTLIVLMFMAMLCVNEDVDNVDAGAFAVLLNFYQYIWVKIIAKHKETVIPRPYESIEMTVKV